MRPFFRYERETDVNNVTKQNTVRYALKSY